MSDQADKLSPSRVARLTDFENRLLRSLDDESVLAEVHASIQRLVASDGCETQIREILQARFDAGDLRPESVELVQQMLDQMTTEEPALASSLELSLVADDDPVPLTATAANDNAASTEDEHPAGPAPSPVTADAAEPVEPPAMAAEAEMVDATPVEEEPPAPPPPKVVKNDPRAYRPEKGPAGTGTLIAGRFLLQRELPGGGVGRVFQAVDERLAGAGGVNSNVAIQILPGDIASNAKSMRTLQQEVAKGRCLKYPGIVRFIDIERDADLHFVVMERLDGKSLATILEEAGKQKIDLDLALNIISQVGSALEFAHKRGVVHGDLQPCNVIVTQSGEIKLFNFGLARVRQTLPPKSGGAGSQDPRKLAASYSSMQVLTGEEPNVADDVFSLACLMYRLVAGFRVFGPRNAADAAPAGMEPQKLEELDATQWQTLKKAMAYSRIPRFASCAEFMASLDGLTVLLEDDEEEEVAETLTVESLGARPQARKWGLLVGAVGLVAAGAAVFQFGLLPTTDDAAGGAPVTAPAAANGSPNGAATAGNRRETTPRAEDEADGSRQSQPQAEFTAMLPPTLTVGLATSGQYIEVVELTLREGGPSATIDVVRMRNILEPYAVMLEEIEDEDGLIESQWGTGQYAVSNDGLLNFEPGQSRARTTISMPGNNRREVDSQIMLRIREPEDEESELALIRIRLEDDDQRTFEAGLPPNTFGFSVREMIVREADTAVQIDAMRYQPDNEPAVIKFEVRDVTATAGEDYFPPEEMTVAFGRGQRTARILIPLVQDAEVEPMETFMIELVGNGLRRDLDIYQRIAVMIHDDDQ